MSTEKTYARAICGVNDPGTNKKPFTVTVYAPSGRGYFHFYTRSAAATFEDRVQGCKNEADLKEVLDAYIDPALTR